MSREARRDLAGIEDFTARRWGEAQARKYIGALWASFHVLAERPRLGRHRPNLPEWVFVHSVGSHLVIYRLGDDDRVEIMNFLHKVMDLPQRLARALIN